MQPGKSHSGITVPEGDVGGLREMAQTFDGLSGAMQRSGSVFGALPAGLSSWQGSASVGFAMSSFQSRLAAIQAGEGFSLKARAAKTYADELEDAQRDSNAAIEDAREAERLIDRAKELIEDAQQRLEAAQAKAALAELEILATGLTGPPSGGAVAAKAEAEDAADKAKADLERGRNLLERGKENLADARERGNRAEQRAEDAATKAQGLFISATPAPLLPTLGSPANGINTNPGSPLWGLPALTPINQLNGAPAFGPLSPGASGPLSPLFPLTRFAMGGQAGRLPTGGSRPFVPRKKDHGKPARGPGNGFIDKKGNEWQWAPGGERAHAGPHWDVQHPDGSHSNVDPDGKVIGDKDNFPNRPEPSEFSAPPAPPPIPSPPAVDPGKAAAAGAGAAGIGTIIWWAAKGLSPACGPFAPACAVVL